MSNKIKVDLGNNSYNVSLIESFKNSVVKFASSTKSQCMLITQQEILNLYKDEIDELSNLPNVNIFLIDQGCLLYTSPSPRDLSTSRMPSSA